MTRLQVRLRAFLHSLLSAQDDEKTALAAADSAAFSMFDAASVSLQFLPAPASSEESSASSSAESMLLHAVSVSSTHALALFCVLASQVINRCFSTASFAKRSNMNHFMPPVTSCDSPFGVVLQVACILCHKRAVALFST